MTGKWRRRAIIGLVAFGGTLAIFVLVLFAICSYRIDRYHLRCVKCLKSARLRTVHVLGVCVSREFRPVEGPSPILDAGPSAPRVPSDSASVYEDILEHLCDHVFKRGGWSQSSPYSVPGLCYAREVDGRAGRQVIYAVRMKAIARLFRLFKSTREKGLARRTYNLVDQFWPPWVVESLHETAKPKAADLWGAADDLYRLSKVETQDQPEWLRKDFTQLYGDLLRGYPEGLKLYFLERSLGLVDTKKAWEQVVQRFEGRNDIPEIRVWLVDFAESRKKSDRERTRARARQTLLQTDLLGQSRAP